MRLKHTILGICMVQASLIVITRGQGGCPEPQEPVHGFSYRRGQDESTINFGCHTGYQLSGNSEAFCICNRYGCSWSSPPPICEEVGSGRSRDCPQPQVPVNGYIVESDGGLQPGASVIYGCDEGYIIRGGDTSTCSCLGAQCQWTTIPTCQQNGDASSMPPKTISKAAARRRRAAARRRLRAARASLDRTARDMREYRAGRLTAGQLAKAVAYEEATSCRPDHPVNITPRQRAQRPGPWGRGESPTWEETSGRVLRSATKKTLPPEPATSSEEDGPGLEEISEALLADSRTPRERSPSPPPPAGGATSMAVH